MGLIRPLFSEEKILKKYTSLDLAYLLIRSKLKVGGTVMELSEMTMHYHGFHPSEFTKDYLEEVMEELYTESPHGSFFQASFSRQNHIFKARVRIDSVNGHFFAVASGKKLKDVTHRVVFQIRKQLSKWKSLRFQKGRPREIMENYQQNLNEEGDQDQTGTYAS